MTAPSICIFGQFIVDVTLPAHGEPYKLRAGGIMHAARALWAIDFPYSLCYCAPEYLALQVKENAKNYGASSTHQFGTISGCPNVMIIGEPKEVGDQRYEFLLRDLSRCDMDLGAVRTCLENSQPTDALIFPGGFDVRLLLETLSASPIDVFADANFEPQYESDFGALGRPFEGLIYSTSSCHFIERHGGSLDALNNALLEKYTKSLLLKENRGGSRFVKERYVLQTPALSRAIQHSVGVGDCFDAIFVALRHSHSEQASLAYASCIAAEYACTTYPEVFRDAAQAWLKVPDDEIVQLRGVAIAWELRPQINVYIAAPDFDHVNRRAIDDVADALKYHNFRPRLPVRENGQMGLNASKKRRQLLCDADMQLLGECQLLVAVLLYDDPGTLIEIGIAIERGIPVIVYDPYLRADNLMLTQLPHCVSSDLDVVIAAVFERAAKGRSR